MEVILKEIEFRDGLINNPISMLFSDSTSEELFCFKTSIEAQFCDKEELIDGQLDPEILKDKICFAKSFIGKKYDLNLYKFTVKELTSNRYVAFELYENDFEGDIIYEDTITDYHIASYMTKEDYIMLLKYKLCLESMHGYVEGVLPDETTEEIDSELFFPRHDLPQKEYKIPYSQYPNINAEFIIHHASVEDIRQGHYLAKQIKDRTISSNDFSAYLNQIIEYRSKVNEIQIANKSLKKKIFFWQLKETIDELELPSDFISWAIDSFILNKVYPKDCNEVTFAKSLKELEKAFGYDDDGEKELRQKLIKLRKQLAIKYKGKNKITPIE